MQWRRGRAYSQDLRERVFVLYDVGDTVGEVADALCVSVSHVSKALSRRHDTGEMSAHPQRWHVPPRVALDLTPIFHPVATRDRRVLSPSLATVATGRDAASLSPAAYAAGVA